MEKHHWCSNVELILKYAFTLRQNNVGIRATDSERYCGRDDAFRGAGSSAPSKLYVNKPT